MKTQALAATLIAITACGEGEIRFRNSDALEGRYTSGDNVAHRGAKLIGEDCAFGSECESGACFGLPGPGICSQNCANAGCPLASFDGTLLNPTVCVPIPGQAPVCLPTCNMDTDPCATGAASCLNIGELSGLCDPADEICKELRNANVCIPNVLLAPPPGTPPPGPPPPPNTRPIGSECPSGSECGFCIMTSQYTSGLCTQDCATMECPSGSSCDVISFGGEDRAFCFADCSAASCTTAGTSCQPGFSGMVCK